MKETVKYLFKKTTNLVMEIIIIKNEKRFLCLAFDIFLMNFSGFFFNFIYFFSHSQE